MFGEPDLPVHGAGRLRQDGLVARPAAATDRAPTAVEQPQLQAMRRPERLEERHERRLRAIQLPVAREEAAVLVAVAVAEHHVLLRERAEAAAEDHGEHARQRVERPHDRLGLPEIADRLEERHHDEVRGGRVERSVAQRAPEEAALLLEQQHLEQIAHVLGVRDDVVADRVAAVAAEGHTRRFEHGQLVARERAVGVREDTHGAGVAEQAEEQRAPLGLGQRRVVRFHARHREQLGDDRLVHVRALPQVDGGQVKAEHLHRADERSEARRHQRAGVAAERVLDHVELALQLARALIRGGRRHGPTCGLGAAERGERGGEARVEADERAAIWLVVAVRIGVGRACGERPQRLRDRGERVGHGQLAAERVDLREVVVERYVGLAPQRERERVRADVRVAVAVAADPVAHS